MTNNTFYFDYWDNGEGRIETVWDNTIYTMLTLVILLLLVCCLLIMVIVLVWLMKKYCNSRARVRRVWNWFGVAALAWNPAFPIPASHAQQQISDSEVDSDTENEISETVV